MFDSAAAAFAPSAFWISDFASSRPADTTGHRGVRFREFLDNTILLFRREGSGASNLDRNLLNLLGIELRHQLAGGFFRQRHQQDGGVANIGHGGSLVDEC